MRETVTISLRQPKRYRSPDEGRLAVLGAAIIGASEPP
jgi:hypothetical protein